MVESHRSARRHVRGPRGPPSLRLASATSGEGGHGRGATERLGAGAWPHATSRHGILNSQTLSVSLQVDQSMLVVGRLKEKLFGRVEQVRIACMQTGQVGVIPHLNTQAHNADGSTPRLRNVSGVHLATVPALPHLVEGRASRRETPSLDLAGRARRQERRGPAAAASSTVPFISRPALGGGAVPRLWGAGLAIVVDLIERLGDWVGVWVRQRIVCFFVVWFAAVAAPSSLATSMPFHFPLC